jgi:hypothetical protein
MGPSLPLDNPRRLLRSHGLIIDGFLFLYHHQHRLVLGDRAQRRLPLRPGLRGAHPPPPSPPVPTCRPRWLKPPCLVLLLLRRRSRARAAAWRPTARDEFQEELHDADCMYLAGKRIFETRLGVVGNHGWWWCHWLRRSGSSLIIYFQSPWKLGRRSKFQFYRGDFIRKDEFCLYPEGNKIAHGFQVYYESTLVSMNGLAVGPAV